MEKVGVSLGIINVQEPVLILAICVHGNVKLVLQLVIMVVIFTFLLVRVVLEVARQNQNHHLLLLLH
jgi:hypothetical protein